MDLLPTPEQDEIVASIAAVLSDRHTLGEPLGDELWSAAAEQGWFGLGLDESLGGVGYTLVEESLLFCEIGRAGAPGPFAWTLAGAHLAAGAGEADVAAAIVSGSARVALAEPDGDRLRLLDHDGATYALLAEDGTFSLVDLAALGPVAAEPALDTLVALGTVARPASLPVVAVAADPDAAGLALGLYLAAQLAGNAAATTAQSVSYAIDREQFGQPIGGFQAVKHRCADMATRADAALQQTRYAALAVGDGRADAPLHAHAAAVVASRAAVDNAQINIQNHGGIGFTWEHTAHRYLTQARTLTRVLGGLPRRLGDLLAAAPAG